MGVRNTVNDGQISAPQRSETEAERRARLASRAIDRDHVHTLRRHLSEGLDPRAEYWSGGSNGSPSGALIDNAAFHGQLECVLALEEAGAELSEKGMVDAMRHPRNRHMILFFLSTGRLDLEKQSEWGRPWWDELRWTFSKESLQNFEQVFCEWERSKLASEAEPQTPRRRPSFL